MSILFQVFPCVYLRCVNANMFISNKKYRYRQNCHIELVDMSVISAIFYQLDSKSVDNNSGCL